MADKYIFHHPGIVQGISPLRPLLSSSPVVEELINARPLKDRLELIKFTSAGSSGGVGVDPILFLRNRLGTPYLVGRPSVYGWADYREGIYVYDAAGSYYYYYDNATVEAIAPVPFHSRIRSVNGVPILLDYPGVGYIGIYKPGAHVPAAGFLEATPTGWTDLEDYTAAGPRGMVEYHVEGCTKVYEVARHPGGLLAFGDGGVSYFIFGKEEAQISLAIPGVLPGHAGCGDMEMGFCIGADHNLWVIQKGQAQNLGFAWIFKDYTRAFLSYCRQTNDLFIVLDKGVDGTDDELVDGQGFIFNQGLSKISYPIYPALFDATANRLIGNNMETGSLHSISLPHQDTPIDFDWDTWDKQVVPPDRDPDLVTSWGDYGLGLDKFLSAVEVIGSHSWPIYVQAEVANRGTPATNTANNVINEAYPYAEFSLNGVRFRYRIWLPDVDEAGSFAMTELRTHLNMEDIRGIYGAIPNTSIPGGRDVAFREGRT